MRRRILVLVICMVSAAVFISTGLVAKTTVDDVIAMKADYKHKKSISQFTHKKHIEEYKINCGECHHDKDGKPLNDLKMGDDVQSCFECHNKPGEIKGKKAKGLSKKQKLEYHGNALHMNCIGCHKKYNKENKTKAAPQKCTECHPKKKKE